MVFNNICITLKMYNYAKTYTVFMSFMILYTGFYSNKNLRERRLVIYFKGNVHRLFFDQNFSDHSLIGCF